LVSVAKGRPAEDRTLWLIGGFKLIKGLLLLVVALGALQLLHKDIGDVTATWASRLHLDVGNRYVDRALGKLMALDDRKLKAISAGTLFYAALLLTEGVGLLLRRRWAEYFTVIVTSSFIPLELYELVKHVTATRVAVIGVNVAVVWYLVVVLRRGSRERG
jgi:uncharacterized membrane protein (DUF2068 family)